MTLFCSTASDVDPGNVAGSRTTEPAAADQNLVEPIAPERPVEQPAVVAVTEVAEENPTQDMAKASTPTRGDETMGTPPPSSGVEEGDKAPSPTRLKKRGPRLQPQRRLPRWRAPLVGERVL